MNGLVGWLGPWYMWAKTFHVVIVFFWIAGLFMLPRYLAYQAEVPLDSPEDLNWRRRTAKIRGIILSPMLVLAWVSGLMVATSYGIGGTRWLETKILLVLLLSLYHWWMVSVAGRMAKGARPLSGKALRLLNEIPGLFTLLLVALAVLKPF